ncbi:MAG: N,N-dimethylformamidase beta subunit family domain-containing protein [Gaiellaceae bacterium]
MTERLTRSRLLGGMASIVAGIALAPGSALAARRVAPRLARVKVGNGERPYEGDRPLFATVSPGVLGRDNAVVSFELLETAHVRLDVVRTALRLRTVIATVEKTFAAGTNEIAWTPDPSTPVGTYIMRLTVEAPGRVPRVYGGARPLVPGRSQVPVVRVLNIEAACNRRSYAPGDLIKMSVFADAFRLTLQILHSGPEAEYTLRNDSISGVQVDKLLTLPWHRNHNAPAPIKLRVGSWQSGLYAARFVAPNGREGFAPFVVRPATLGASRQAVVMPTNTWQAYNFYDADGDGFGDTWYAGGNPPVDLTRPYRERGVPPRFHRYDAPFLHWLSWAGKTPDFLCDDDLDAMESGDRLRELYDVVVFPGHTEYETSHVFDVMERYRDLGGLMIFLSANSFFWKVNRRPDELRRVKLWRDLKRPEATLIGSQYRANDNGSRRGVFTVANATKVPWLYQGTGLVDGATFGTEAGGYGIEIDATTKRTPPGTLVVGVILNIFGQGINAEMTYYETAAGARVFNAGALDFSGSVMNEPMRTMLSNLWTHMATV